MLEKLKVIGQYIKDNDVGPAIKERFLKLVKGYKDKMGQLETPHKKIMGKLMEHKKKMGGSYNPMVRPEGEAPVSDGDGVQAQADRDYANDKNKGTPAPDLEKMQEEYKRKALSNF